MAAPTFIRPTPLPQEESIQSPEDEEVHYKKPKANNIRSQPTSKEVKSPFKAPQRNNIFYDMTTEQQSARPLTSYVNE